MRRSVLLLGQEWVGDFFVAIYGTEEGDCWATQDNQTEAACCLLGFCPGAKEKHMIRVGGRWEGRERTGLEDFLDVIEDEVQELVETLEDAGHCDGIDHPEHLLVARGGAAARTFSSAGELNPDPFVHVFGEIQDRLAFWFVHCWLWSLWTMVPATTPG